MSGNLKDFLQKLKRGGGGACSPVRQTVEKHSESAKGSGPLEFSNVSGGVYGGHGAIESGGKSHFPEQKSLPCSFCVRKSESFFCKNWRGVAGALALPSAGLSKNTRRAQKAQVLSNFQSCPTACTTGTGRLFAAKNLIFQNKNRFPCSFCARKSERFFAKTEEGWQWRRRLFSRPPACRKLLTG